MSVSEEAFESWCLRSGGETYEEGGGPGIACQCPGTDVPDRIHYHPDTDTFDVVTRGVFFESRTIHQRAGSWIDDDDRLHIDTEDSRLVIDPR